MDGDRLPEGNTTDKGMDRLQVAIKNLLELSPADYDQPKAKTKQTWLDDLSELLDPAKNPSSYRICQDAAESRGVVAPLLGLAQKAPNDGLRNRAAEVLARLTFGNERAAASIVGHGEFFPTLQSLLKHGNYTERLGALQLAQAIAASPAPEVVAATPALVTEVVPQLAEASFEVIPNAALEVLISASFHDPAAVANAASLPYFASIIADDANRPAWLHMEPLQIFTCGLLCTNILRVPTPEGEQNELARVTITDWLAHGQFMLNVLLAMEAAANRCEWPPGSNAFHSPSRLAETISKLGSMGYRRQLFNAVSPLSKVIESNPDPRTTHAALRALNILGHDVKCLEAILALEAFRNETLEVLHQSGDEKEATELVLYLANVESMFNGAQTTLETSRAHIKNAPSVDSLAEAFNSVVRMDAELQADQLFDVLRLVPIGPFAAVRATFSGGKLQGLNFQDFAQRVYGTPTILGWWPSLMEDTATLWEKLGTLPPLLPPLHQLVHFFENGTHGTSGISGEKLLEEVFPAMGLPVEGEVVEEFFAEIRGDGLLDLPKFAEWLSRLCTQLHQEELATQQNADAA